MKTIHHEHESVSYFAAHDQAAHILVAGHRHQAVWREKMVLARTCFLLTYVYAGCGTVTDQSQTTVCKGQWFCLFPNEVLFYEADRKTPWQYYWLGIDGKDVANHLHQADITPASRFVTDQNPKLARKLFENLCQHPAKTQQASQLAGNGSMMLLLSHLVDQASTNHTGPIRSNQHDAVQRACTMMQHQYTHPINASLVAQQVGMDRSHLCGLFKEQMGITMYTYLWELRLRHAQNLLRSHPQLTVQQIALAVGYEEYRSFSRKFKQTIGQTPSAYGAKFQLGSNR